MVIQAYIKVVRWHVSKHEGRHARGYVSKDAST